MKEDFIQVRDILNSLKTMGNQGMSQNYNEWLSFHEKVAQRASHALDMLDYVGKDLEHLESKLKEIANEADTCQKCIVTSDEGANSMEKIRKYYGLKFFEIKKMARV